MTGQKLILRGGGEANGIRYGFTTRRGGVSAEPFASLNLGGRSGDDPRAVARNRERLAEQFGVSTDHLVLMDQHHSAEVAVIDGPATRPLRVDAVVTRAAGLALAALVADCTPVLLRDPHAGVIAAVHAGREGFIKGVVRQAMTAMRDLGASAIDAVVGPSICGRCYELPAAMVDRAAEVAAVCRTLSWSGTPAADIAAGVVQQLRECGVDSLEWVRGCTAEDPCLYSYRGDGQTGRSAGVIVRLDGLPEVPADTTVYGS